LIVGVVGFFFADEFTKGGAADEFIIFRLNHLHNIINVDLGVVWIGASRTATATKAVNVLLDAILIVVALVGFTAIDLVHTLLNIVDSSDPENFLHLATGALAIYFGTAGAAGRSLGTV
jgi:hypothetical protein